MLLSRQLRWAGHLARMDDSRMPKAILVQRAIREGKQTQERPRAPKKRFKNQLKRQLNLTSIQEQHWENIAKDRIAGGLPRSKVLCTLKQLERQTWKISVNGGRLQQPCILQMGSLARHALKSAAHGLIYLAIRNLVAKS